VPLTLGVGFSVPIQYLCATIIAAGRESATYTYENKVFFW